MKFFCNYLSLVHILCILSYRAVNAYDGFNCPPSNSETTAVKLRDSLVCNYDRDLRPVADHRNATSIIFRLILKYFAYETYTHVLTLDAWLTVVWKNEHLTWNPAEHDGIKYLHLHTSDMWTPDLSVYNMANQGVDPNLIGDSKCLVTSKGQVQGVIPIHLEILCVPNLTRYPFDTQNCTVRFGSWVHKGEELDIKLAKEILGTEELEPNGEWKLVSHSAIKNAGKYQCCPNESYPSIEISMRIKRLSGSHAAGFVIPLIAGVILTFVYLSMSPINKDRLTLCYVCFIGQFIHIQFLTWQLPLHGDNVPLLIIFSRDALLLTVFAILFTVIFRNILQRKNTPPPWISSIVSVVISCRPGQFLLLSDYSTRAMNVQSSSFNHNIIFQSSSKQSGWAPMTQQQSLVTEAMNVQSSSFNHNIVFQSSSKQSGWAPMTQQQSLVTEGVATAKGEEDGATIVSSESEPKSQDWELFAKILDKLFLYCYIIVYFVMILAFLP